MAGLVSHYLVDMVIVAMSGFAAVMLYVCIEDAVRHPGRGQTR